MDVNTQSLTSKNKTKPERDVKFCNGEIVISFGFIRGHVAMRTFKYLLPVLGMI